MDQELEDNIVNGGELLEMHDINDRFSRSFYLPCECDPEDEEKSKETHLHAPTENNGPAISRERLGPA